MSRLPALFVSHGAPPLLDDALWMRELADWGRALPTPRALLVVSAHWETPPHVTLGATATVPLVYDYYGFPERYYRITYPSPGAPDVAARVRELVPGVKQDALRGLDHGVFVPLLAMWPAADVPVLQVSLPSLDPKAVYALGRALAPLRDEGVLLVGSGFFTHNLRALGMPNQPWTVEFDRWGADALRRRDDEALLDFLQRTPSARLAHPRTEHFVPLFFALGASVGEPARFPVEGFAFGPFSKRSVELGAV